MYSKRHLFLVAIKTQLEPNIVKHSLALEACMGGIYDYLQAQGRLSPNEPPKVDWLLAGLVHDIDFSGDYKDFHPQKTQEVLAKYDLTISQIVDDIVKAHDSRQGFPAAGELAKWAILCADSLTGFIVAVALIYPTKKLVDVKLSSVMKRLLKQPRFAAGTRREEIVMCERKDGLGIPLEKFVEICLLSMQKIASEIGL